MIEEAHLQFLRSTLPTVWALELMLFLRGHPEKEWTPEAVTLELRASLPLVTELLGHFQRAGLVGRTEQGHWVWRPANEQLRASANAIAEVHARTPFRVIQAIMEAPNDRLRTFSDAFKLRKPERPE